MVRNPLIRAKPKMTGKGTGGHKSAGILDDFAIRKNVATKEGTIEQVPTEDNHIVNKKYVDDAVLGEDFWDKTGTTIHQKDFTDSVAIGKSTAGARLDVLGGDGDTYLTQMIGLQPSNVTATGSAIALTCGNSGAVSGLGGQMNITSGAGGTRGGHVKITSGGSFQNGADSGDIDLTIGAPAFGGAYGNINLVGSTDIKVTGSDALLVEKEDGTDIFKVDTNSDLVYTGKVRPRSNDAYDIGENATRFRDLFLSGDISTTGAIDGVNVTSGADPGHTHTDGSLTVAHASTTGQTTDDHHAQVHNMASHSDDDTYNIGTSGYGEIGTTALDHDTLKLNNMYPHKSLILDGGADDCYITTYDGSNANSKNDITMSSARNEVHYISTGVTGSYVWKNSATDNKMVLSDAGLLTLNGDLQINGDANFDDGAFTNVVIEATTAPVLQLRDTGAPAGLGNLSMNCLNSVGKFRALTDAGEISVDNMLVFDLSNGNVGIDESAPDSKLEVNGTGHFTGAVSVNAGPTPTNPLHVYAGYQSDDGIRIQGSSTNWYIKNLYSASGDLAFNDGTHDVLTLHTNNNADFLGDVDVAGDLNVTTNAAITGTTTTTGMVTANGGVDVASTTGALIVPRMTTVEKNALTPVNGMIVYDYTILKFQFYENGAWVSGSGLA